MNEYLLLWVGGMVIFDGWGDAGMDYGMDGRMDGKMGGQAVGQNGPVDRMSF